MRSSSLGFYFDNLFVKDGHGGAPTPYHEDASFQRIHGAHAQSFWIALDDIPSVTALQFLAGSHRRDEPIFLMNTHFDEEAEYDAPISRDRVPTHRRICRMKLCVQPSNRIEVLVYCKPNHERFVSSKRVERDVFTPSTLSHPGRWSLPATPEVNDALHMSMSQVPLPEPTSGTDRPAPPIPYQSCFSMPLSPDELREHQQRYLNTPTYRYGMPARLLFWTAGKVFPQGRSFEFFAFVELVARVPYMAWEHVGHIAQTQTHNNPEFGRKIQDRVYLARDEQDNEYWHLLIMEEFLKARDYKRRWFFDKVFPQILSFLYYQLSWMLFVVKPEWSYRLNSDFEDHAMRQYAAFVDENPQFDEMEWMSDYRGDYGFHATVGDMLRQIAVDEEQHKDHSDGYIERGARFSRETG